MTGGQARDLRHAMTVSEARLWSRIRRRALGVRFRRQVPIGMWIVDFACLRPRLVIEVDDRSHDWRDEQFRTMHLREQGFHVVRFTNKQVATDLDAVVNTISNVLASLSPAEE
jgi:very-short-patch-repair endonuclease